MKRYFVLILYLSICHIINGQDVSLFQQFNGRYDYTAIGNTLNIFENGPFSTCDILTTSSADLTLNSNQNIIAAYLYWAGSGDGDLEVTLNGNNITASRVFNDSLDANRVFFAAFADVTNIVTTLGNTTYTLSNFDLTNVISPYCSTGTNFGGWAITIIYEDDTLPLNQLNVYDGLQSVPDFLSITLNNLNVLDTNNAKIGFIAWEGDNALAVNEQLTINGNVISNLPLNPPDNAFNGTNSFTGATNLYNMDIDVYNIQNNINIGDTTANIALTSGQDFVMINNIITVLNSQLPDASIEITDYFIDCVNDSVILFYTIFNVNSTDTFPTNTPIAFYVDNELIAQTSTTNPIPINESEDGSISITIENSFNTNFNITAHVDDDGTMNGIITEIDEDNNSAEITLEVLLSPEIITLPNLLACNEGFETATYNLFDAVENETINNEDIVFFTSIDDLNSNTNAIIMPEVYNNLSNPETIYLKANSGLCTDVYQFQTTIENCPPIIPQGFSPNNDSINDWFNIQGLYNIFTNHELKIFNRLGDCIFRGDNNTPWDGKLRNGNLVPVGTYYYILNLRDTDYKPFCGWVYVNY